MHRVIDRISTSREAGAGRDRARREPTRSHTPRPSPAFRSALVDRIRREIQSGEYDSPWRLDAAADRLLERLNPSPR